MRVFTIAILSSAVIAAGAGAADAANLAPAGNLPYAITLKYHHASDLDTLINNQTDPSSPLYGKFLTPDEFRRYFAPLPAEYAATITQLRHAGFTITGTSPNRTVIDVSASASSVSHAFGYPSTNTGARSNMPRRLTASAALPYVDGIVGVGSARSAETGYRAMGASALHSRYGHRDHDGNPGFLVGPDGGFGPAALTHGLNFPVVHGYDGAGITVADIVDGHPIEADIATFLNAFHIRRTGPPTVVVPIDGGNGPDQDLADIDVEWILGTAPGVRLYVYEMSVYTDTIFVDALNRIVSDNVVDVANMSRSSCESDTVDLALAIQPIFKQGAAQGIAFETPAFGIQGQCGVPDTLFPVVPSDSQDVLAVSGTNVIEDAEGEVVAQTGMSLSGGGVSGVVEAFPAQLRIKGVDPSGRNTPDISMASEINGNGPSSYFAGGWNGSFLFVNNIPASSLMAEYQQMAHHRLGAFDRTLYHMFARRGYGDGIIDITSGCDGVYLGVPICATHGYDHMSGIGAIANAYELGRRIRH